MFKNSKLAAALGIIGIIVVTGLIYRSHLSGKQAEEVILPPAAQTLEQTRGADPATATISTTTAAVDPNFVYKKNICTGANAGKFECYQAYYQSLVKNDGVPTAFVGIKKRYTEDPFVVSSCHQLGHVIGREAAQLYTKVSEAYVHGDSFCWSGYYHGVIEGFGAKYGEGQFPKVVNQICADIPGKNNYSFDYYNCVHGLGHAAMSYTEDELFDSLKICDNLNGSWEQTSCYGGVFMENIMVDNRNHFTKYLKPSDPVYPCNAVDDKYKQSCFLMQTSYMLKVSGEDFNKVFSLCRGVEGSYKDTCFQSLGRDASGNSVSNADITSATCNLGTNFEEKSNCIIGAVKDFISYYHSDKQATVLCAKFSPDLAKVCTDTATQYYKSF